MRYIGIRIEYGYFVHLYFAYMTDFTCKRNRRNMRNFYPKIHIVELILSAETFFHRWDKRAPEHRKRTIFFFDCSLELSILEVQTVRDSRKNVYDLACLHSSTMIPAFSSIVAAYSTRYNCGHDTGDRRANSSCHLRYRAKITAYSSSVQMNPWRTSKFSFTVFLLYFLTSCRETLY